MKALVTISYKGSFALSTRCGCPNTRYEHFVSISYKGSFA